MTTPRVTVVGGGVVGLTSAVRLAGAGAAVRVLTADPVARTTSAVAAAIWTPYRAAPADRVDHWAGTTFDVLAALAAVGVPGVAMRSGRNLLRTGEVPSWAGAVPGARVVASDVPGVVAEWHAAVPVVDMGRYLPWLLARCEAAGVVVETATVGSVAEVDGDVVVLAAGLRSGPFVDDTSSFPVRGQVVRLANPGITGWVLDDDHPAGLTYVVARGDDVVCGGTDDEGEWGTDVDPAVESRILQRCVELVPELQGAPVRSRAVGLRPGRPAVRLDATEVGGRRVVACYGHGGAGVTLSWGCAAEVTALALSP